MYRRLIFILDCGVAFFLLAGGCIEVNVNDKETRTIHSSGEVETVDYDYRDFAAVSIADTFVATIQQGDEYAVAVRADKNAVDFLHVAVRDGVLEVGLENNTRLRGSFTLEVDVTLPALETLEVSGASTATVGHFVRATSLGAEVSGASRLTLVADGTDLNLDVHLSGASKATLNGRAGALHLEASGASTIDAQDLEAATCDAELSGASTVHVRVTGTLGPARLSGASTLRYEGTPQLVDIETSGASSIHRASP